MLPTALVLALSAGCQKEPATVARPQPVFGSGSIVGKIHFKGPSPQLQPILDESCCPGAPKTLPDETVVVSDKGELANVVVYMTGITPSDGSSRPLAVLDQKFCQFVPHVLAVQVGQPLKITTSDQAPHNVHFNPDKNPAGNFAMTVPGDSRTITFQNPEFIDFRCDVHPWMKARVAVLDNPFFAVTDNHGNFKIDRIPPGNYTLHAWHERYGELTEPVAIKDSGAIGVQITYEPETGNP